MMPIPQTDKYVVTAFYQFLPLHDVAGWQTRFLARCTDCQLLGTILLAEEGVNGTVAGRAKNMHSFVQWLETQTPFTQPEIKFATHTHPPFHRLKIRLKKEIVTMGKEYLEGQKDKEGKANKGGEAGNYVAPKEWNALISDPDMMVVDVRNEYEIAIGQFAGAVNPQTKTFRQFPEWAEEIAQRPPHTRPKKLAMYCTGGIRCEKSTAWMKQLGFEEVYHLKGGILRYLEEIDKNESLWEGECFVFDSRVAVDHDLKKGSYELCYACKMPLSAADMRHKAYQPSLSCPHCIDVTSAQQRKRFAERAHQIDLAKQRGAVHLGRKKTQKKI